MNIAFAGNPRARTLALLGCSLGWLGFAATAAQAEVAQSADGFVEKMGINTHTAGSYDAAKFGQLGIRHFRDNLAPSTGSTSYTRLSGLYSTYGIRINAVADKTDSSHTPALYQTFLKNAPMEAVEGLNEPDLNGPRSYGGYTDNFTTQSYPATLQFQTDLYNLMKGDPATSGKAVYSPAMGDAAKSFHLNGVLCDSQAMHSYSGGQMPTGGNLDSYQITGTQAMGSGAVSQIVATETGYVSGTATADISDAAAGKYLPRLFAEYFNRGIGRTYSFEMLDTPGVYDYGLLRSDLSLKPAYTNLKNLIALLQEGTWNVGSQVWMLPNFGPGVLDYTMTGGNGSVHHTLLQKSTGEFYLLLWQEVPSYNQSTHADISNPTVPVTLNFNTPIATASTYQLASLSATGIYAYPTSLTVNVPDELLVVALTPDTSYTPPASPAVSIQATDASATEAPVTNGTFTVTRTGSTAAALTVNYTTSGTATGGTDYTALSGSVTIPAGAASALITVTPTGTASGQGIKTVVATLGSGAYNVSTRRSASVQLTMGDGIIDDFEDHNITTAPHQWTHGARSTPSLVGPGDGGSSYAMCWVYNDDGATQWNNSMTLNLPSAQDWTGVSKIRIRFAEDAGNPATDLGQKITFDYANNGVRVNGGAGVTSFALTGNTAYRTLEFDLGRYQRNQVTYLMFFLDGNAYATGNHTFVIDNITAVSGTDGSLTDFEAAALTNWTAAPRSTISLDSTNSDSGAYALKWLYNDDGVTRWGNNISQNYPAALDWSRYSKLVLRLKTDAANPAADVGKSIVVDWSNNGTSVSGGSGVATITLDANTNYRTVTVNLGNYPRDKVTRLNLYVDGNLLNTGNHVWYLDNLTLF